MIKVNFQNVLVTVDRRGGKLELNDSAEFFGS
jgi:hypothetical protein